MQTKTVIRKYHPHYGEVVYTSEGLLVCHICGKAFKKLGAHVWNTHKIRSREYKQMYGLDLCAGLCSEAHKKVLREHVIEHYDQVVGENLTKRGAGTRFRLGSAGRPKEMVSEQTRRRLHDLGERTIKNTKNHKKSRNSKSE